MKALVAVPPVNDFYFTPQRASALGALAVKKILNDFDINCTFFNFSKMMKKPSRLPIPSEFDYLKPFFVKDESGPFSFFNKYYRFGPDIKTCTDIILKESPNIVFLSCFAWAYSENTINLANALKAISANIKIAVGGAGISVNPEYFSKIKSIDFVLTGKAEISLPLFLEKEYKIKKIKKRKLDFYWDITGESKQKNIRYISTMLTRGCPKACRFCANHLVHGREFIKTDISLVEAGIKNFPKNMNLHVNFEDDNILLDKEYFFAVLEIIKKIFPNAEFSAENGLDYTLMDITTTEKLIKYGFKSFNLSIATSDNKILKQESREAALPKLKEIVNIASKKGVYSTCYFICGLASDNKNTVINNLIQLYKLPVLSGISLFYPVPGLPNFPAKKMSNFRPTLCAGSSAYPWTGSLSTKELITSFRLSRVSNAIKTTNGIIPNKTSPSLSVEKLIKIIKQNKKLYTLSAKKIVEVPNQDFQLVKDFFLQAEI